MGELDWAREQIAAGLQRLERQLGDIDRKIEALSVELRGAHPSHAIVGKYVRCGKPNCHCAQPGDPGHGPYFYLRYKRNGRLVEHYLGKEPPKELEGAIPAAEYRRLQARLRKLRRERERLLGKVAGAIAALGG